MRYRQKTDDIKLSYPRLFLA